MKGLTYKLLDNGDLEVSVDLETVDSDAAMTEIVEDLGISISLQGARGFHDAFSLETDSSFEPINFTILASDIQTSGEVEEEAIEENIAFDENLDSELIRKGLTNPLS